MQMFYLILRLLVEKLVLLQRTLDTAVHQKSRARLPDRQGKVRRQIAKGKVCQATKDKEKALMRAQAAEANPLKRLFRHCCVISLTFSGRSRFHGDQTQRSADAVTEAKDARLRRRLEEQDTEKACVISLEFPRTLLLLPCSHLCVYSNCLERKELVGCPLCRVAFHSESKMCAYYVVECFRRSKSAFVVSVE